MEAGFLAVFGEEIWVGNVQSRELGMIGEGTVPAEQQEFPHERAGLVPVGLH